MKVALEFKNLIMILSDVVLVLLNEFSLIRCQLPGNPRDNWLVRRMLPRHLWRPEVSLMLNYKTTSRVTKSD